MENNSKQILQLLKEADELLESTSIAIVVNNDVFNNIKNNFEEYFKDAISVKSGIIEESQDKYLGIQYGRLNLVIHSY